LSEAERLIPKVSVCVITYNQEKYIDQCLQSILDQETDFDFEVIVGDDCSTDGTLDIVKKFVESYPSTFRLILQDKNTGGGKNYLDVHAAAKCSYVTHIDGDDLMLPGKLQTQSNFLDNNLGCSLVWHAVMRFKDGEENILDGIDKYRDGITKVSLADYIIGLSGYHSSMMYRASSRGVYGAEEIVMDWLFSAECLYNGYGVLLHECLGMYRVSSGESLSMGDGRRKMRILMVKNMKRVYKSCPHLKKFFFIRSLINFYFFLGARHCRQLEVKEFRLVCFFIVFINPVEIYNCLCKVRKFGKVNTFIVNDSANMK